MKVLIVSDTHKHNENLEEVLKKVKPIDMLVHCGDAECIPGVLQGPHYILFYIPHTRTGTAWR